MSFSRVSRPTSRRTGSKQDSSTASGVSSMITLTPVTDSKARMLRPSRPMIRPFISSLGRCSTLTDGLGGLLAGDPLHRLDDDRAGARSPSTRASVSMVRTRSAASRGPSASTPASSSALACSASARRSARARRALLSSERASWSAAGRARRRSRVELARSALRWPRGGRDRPARSARRRSRRSSRPARARRSSVSRRGSSRSSPRLGRVGERGGLLRVARRRSARPRRRSRLASAAGRGQPRPRLRRRRRRSRAHGLRVERRHRRLSTGVEPSEHQAEHERRGNGGVQTPVMLPLSCTKCCPRGASSVSPGTRERRTAGR